MAFLPKNNPQLNSAQINIKGGLLWESDKINSKSFVEK